VNKRPLLIGILNATPDSFYSAHSSLERAIERGVRIAQEGADIIDIGGESTRPDSLEVSEEEELRRVLPLIEALTALVSIPLSIDTRKAKVAKQALAKGAKLINDITGFCDPSMQELAAASDADICLMHMHGSPQTMQIDPHYPEGVVEHIMHFFERRIKELIHKGVKESRIILDPGIGFGKTVEHNFLILQSIDQFKSFGLRVLIGASRKWFIRKILNKPIEDTLAATLAVHSYCLFKGADVIRVHDVQEHRDAIDLIFHLN
jgi:dihydropteroate synthase